MCFHIKKFFLCCSHFWTTNSYGFCQFFCLKLEWESFDNLSWKFLDILVQTTWQMIVLQEAERQQHIRVTVSSLGWALFPKRLFCSSDPLEWPNIHKFQIAVFLEYSSNIFFSFRNRAHPKFSLKALVPLRIKHSNISKALQPFLMMLDRIWHRSAKLVFWNSFWWWNVGPAQLSLKTTKKFSNCDTYLTVTVGMTEALPLLLQLKLELWRHSGQ